MLTSVNSAAKDRILSAALAVLRRGGLAEVTMRSVGAEAGVSATALYRHFQDRDALVAAVRARVAAAFRDRVMEALREKTSERRLFASVEVFARFALEVPWYFDLLFVESPHRSETAEGRLKKPGTIFQLLVDRVRECMDDGVIGKGDPVKLGLMLAAQAQGLVLLQRRGRFDSAEEFLRFFRSAIKTLISGMK